LFRTNHQDKQKGGLHSEVDLYSIRHYYIEMRSLELNCL